jgi:hypothetical protein
MSLIDSFTQRVDTYQNTLEANNRLHTEFTQLIETVPFIFEHRKYVETHKLGFGDRAFHYMWYLLLLHLTEKFSHPRFLEIGVYKGQIISLWAFLASQLNLEVSITAISPLEGNSSSVPKSKLVKKLMSAFNPQFREDLNASNFYPEDDYEAIISALFKSFNLSYSKIRMIQGYSNDESVLKSVKDEKFYLIYIDGDHTFAGATQDIKNYSSKIEEGGFLVMDDASYYLPGSNFWKGHEAVSRACEIIPSLGFINIMNVGHNRIYRKDSSTESLGS